MQWKCLLFPLSLAVIVRSASISNNDIPVKVVYDHKYQHRNYIRNLNEKVQISAEQLRQLELRPDESEGVYNEQDKNVVKNLDEKVQLSSEELKQFPLEESTPQVKSTYVNAIRNLDEKVQLSSDEQSEALKHLPLIDNNDDYNENNFRTVMQEQNDYNLYKQVEEIVNKGLQNLKNNAQKSDLINDISPEVWKRLESDVSEFLDKIKTKYSVRQSNQNIVQQFQQFTSNFLSQFSQPGTANDESQQPGFPQNVVGFFTNGLQQIQTGLSNLTGQNQQPAENDPDASTQAPNNPLQGFVSSVQGVFSQLNPFNPGQGQPPSTQGEETTQPGGPLQSFQNAFNQFGETLSNLNPFNPPTQKPGTASDEGSTTAAGPLQIVQGIASQAGQVFNQFNPFQPSTAKPPEADPTKNPAQAAAESVGSQISGAFEQLGGAVQGGNNPLEVAQGVAGQVGEAINSNNPLQSGNNPLEAAQGVAQQVSEAVAGNNPLQGGSNPLQVVGEAIVANNPLQGGSNPLEAAQGVAQQIGEAVGNNPLQNVLPPSASKENEKE